MDYPQHPGQITSAIFSTIQTASRMEGRARAKNSTPDLFTLCAMRLNLVTCLAPVSAPPHCSRCEFPALLEQDSLVQQNPNAPGVALPEHQLNRLPGMPSEP